MRGREFDSPQEQEGFLSYGTPRPAVGPTQPPVPCVPGFFFSLVGKQPGL
jgi:hypothetical protein